MIVDPYLIESTPLFFDHFIAGRIHYSKTALCFLLNDIRPPKKTTFYEQQKKVVNCLCQMSCESMQKAASETQPSDVVSVDGAWDHWRE